MTTSDERVFISSSPEDTRAIAASIADMPFKVIGLTGELGAGKTVFAKGYFSHLGIEEEWISSPSFVIVNTYEYEGQVFHHMDLYRYSVFEDDFGFWELVSSGERILIEWADRLGEDIEELDAVVHICLEGSSRRIVLSHSKLENIRNILDF